MPKDPKKLHSLQTTIRAMQSAGQKDDLIVDRLLKNENVSSDFKRIFQSSKTAGIQAKAVEDFLSLPSVKPSLVRDEDFEIPGKLGGISRFLGVEPLARRIGAGLARFDPQQRETIELLKEQGREEEARTLATGGVSGRELLGSIGQTALTVGAFPASRALSGLKFGRRVLGEAGLGVGFGASGALQEEGGIKEGALLGAGLGAAFPLAGGFIRGVRSGGVEVLTDLLKATTGAPKQALEEVITATTREQRKAIRTAATQQLNASGITQNIRNASNLFKKERDEVFEAGMGAIRQIYPKASREASVVLQSTRNHFKKEAIARGIRFKGNKIVFIPPRISSGVPQAETNIKKAWGTLSSQKSATPGALNSLGADLNALANFEKGITTKEIPIVNSTVGFLKEGIEDVYSELGELRNFFSVRSGITDVFDDVFKATKEDPKGLTQAITKARSIFTENNVEYLKAVRQLDQISGTNFVKELAGESLQRIAPGILRAALAVGGIGTGAFLVNPMALLLLPLFSPRAVQSVLRNVSMATPVKNAIIGGLESPAARATGRTLLGATEAEVGRNRARDLSQ